MVLVLECLINVKTSKIKIFIFALLILSSVPFSLVEYSEVIYYKILGENTRYTGPFATMDKTFATMLDKKNNGWYNNFAGSVDSIYYQYLAPHRGVLPVVGEDTAEANNDEKESLDTQE